MELEEIILGQGDQDNAKKLFRRFQPPPKLSKDYDLYAEVCGQQLKRAFPELAKKIEYAKEHGKPLLIRNFPIGYVPRLGKDAHYTIQDIQANSKFSRLDHAFNHSYFMLGTAVTNILGMIASSTADWSEEVFCGLNTRNGQSPHTHPEEWSIVVCLRGRKEARTHLYEGKEDRIFASPALMRGDVLIVPPQMKHSVDKFIPQTFPIGTEEEKSVERATITIFSNTLKRAFTDAQIEQGEKRYLRPPKAAERA